MSSYTPPRPRHVAKHRRDKRPVQFLLIEVHNLITRGDPERYIIQEKFSEILAGHTYPYRVKNHGRTRFPTGSSLLRIEVSRHTMEWRKPVASDTGRKVGTGLLAILYFATSNPHGTPDLASEGVPGGADSGKSGTNSVVYSSWDAFLKSAKNKEQEAENKMYADKYRDKPLH